jgi:2-oxoglutarate dehydrogenase E1 component
MDKYSYISNAHPEVIDSMFAQYKQNPESVDITWQKFFEGFEFAKADFSSPQGGIPENVAKEFKVIQLINGYRQRGHLFTKIFSNTGN